MPLMILYGGELVFLFLGARVARWMWRSRENVVALWRARHGGAGLTPDPAPDPSRAPAPIARGVVRAFGRRSRRAALLREAA
ncbi:MAG TPA: hypothetical protein VFT98_12390 [Myxococcota bacterium]|nr:hypothetical protein [Myxococcota bacterium]